jgi:hypothetical protein
MNGRGKFCRDAIGGSAELVSSLVTGAFSLTRLRGKAMRPGCLLEGEFCGWVDHWGIEICIFRGLWCCCLGGC